MTMREIREALGHNIDSSPSNRPPVPEGWEFRLSPDRRLFAFYDPGNGPWFVPEPAMRGRFVDSADMDRLGWYRYVPAPEDDADSVGLVSRILHRTAELVDSEDLPQTAGSTADFCEGARWATAEVRRIADEVTVEDPAWRPTGLDELAQQIRADQAPEKTGPPVSLTPCTHVKALHDTEHDGLIVEGCSWCAGREQLGTPSHTKSLVHVTSTGVRPGLNSAERAMLRYALELVGDKMAFEGDEFAAVDYAAVESLKLLAGEE
jgi:hypothetical protein